MKRFIPWLIIPAIGLAFYLGYILNKRAYRKITEQEITLLSGTLKEMEARLTPLANLIKQYEKKELFLESFHDPALMESIARQENNQKYGVKDHLIPNWVKEKYPKDEWHLRTAHLTLQLAQNRFCFEHRREFLKVLSDQWQAGESKKDKTEWQKSVLWFWGKFKK